MSGRSLNEVLSRGEELLRTWCPPEAKEVSPVRTRPCEVVEIAERKLREVERDLDVKPSAGVLRNVGVVLGGGGREEALLEADTIISQISSRHRDLSEELLLVSAGLVKEMGRNTSLAVDCRAEANVPPISLPIFPNDTYIEGVATQLGSSIFDEVIALRETVAKLQREARLRVDELHILQEKSRHAAQQQTLQAADTSHLRTILTSARVGESRAMMPGLRVVAKQGAPLY